MASCDTLIMLGVFPIILAAAAAQPVSSGHVARMGQIVRVEGPRVQPLAIVEDSRCAKEVQCIWAGQVMLRVRVRVGARWSVRVMTLGTAEQVADGALTLTRVLPAPTTKRRLRASDYRFTFSFEGGL
jgi:hypothetical protein